MLEYELRSGWSRDWEALCNTLYPYPSPYSACLWSTTILSLNANNVQKRANPSVQHRKHDWQLAPSLFVPCLPCAHAASAPNSLFLLLRTNQRHYRFADFFFPAISTNNCFWRWPHRLRVDQVKAALFRRALRALPLAPHQLVEWIICEIRAELATVNLWMESTILEARGCATKVLLKH